MTSHAQSHRYVRIHWEGGTLLQDKFMDAMNNPLDLVFIHEREMFPSFLTF
jgi:hypothetical protein